MKDGRAQDAPQLHTLSISLDGYHNGGCHTEWQWLSYLWGKGHKSVNSGEDKPNKGEINLVDGYRRTTQPTAREQQPATTTQYNHLHNNHNHQHDNYNHHRHQCTTAQSMWLKSGSTQPAIPAQLIIQSVDLLLLFVHTR